jgi:hypothetical protein
MNPAFGSDVFMESGQNGANINEMIAMILPDIHWKLNRNALPKINMRRAVF